MPEMFKAKTRKIGTSLGVIIPSEVIKKARIKEGTEIEITLFNKDPEALKLLNEAFGSVKNAKWKFKRDRIDRLERYENASR